MSATLMLLIMGIFFLWCMKWLFNQIPGGNHILPLGQKVFKKVFRGEKVSGSRFQNEREMISFLSSRNKGVVLDGEGKKRLGEKESFAHVALISPTGAGKTTNYIIPNTLLLDDCSIIINDPSGEIYQKTSSAMTQKGYAIKTLNLEHPEQSLGYNPLIKANTFEEINQLALTLIHSATPEVKAGDEIFYSSPAKLISMLIRTLKNTNEPEWINLHNVLHLLNNFGAIGENLFPFFNRYADEATYEQFAGFISGNQKMISSFLTTAIDALQVVNDNPAIASMLSRDEISFDELRQRKTVVYIIAPSQKLKLYSPILNLFFSQFFASQYKPEYINSGLPLFVLYDEFGHSRINDMDIIMTTLRKYRVSISIILQEFSQLRKQYGVDGAKTLLAGGVQSKIVYGGLDIETATIVESMLGKISYEDKRGNGTSRSYTNLMNADRISRIPHGKALFVSSNQEPMMFDTTPCYKNRHLERLMNLPPVPLPSPLPVNLHHVPLV